MNNPLRFLSLSPPYPSRNRWPLPAKYLNGYEEAVGSIEISLKATYVPEFDRYYLTRNSQNNTRNHWFEEFWDCEGNDASTECAGISSNLPSILTRIHFSLRSDLEAMVASSFEFCFQRKRTPLNLIIGRIRKWLTL